MVGWLFGWLEGWKVGRLEEEGGTKRLTPLYRGLSRKGKAVRRDARFAAVRERERYAPKKKLSRNSRKVENSASLLSRLADRRGRSPDADDASEISSSDRPSFGKHSRTVEQRTRFLQIGCACRPAGRGCGWPRRKRCRRPALFDRGACVRGREVLMWSSLGFQLHHLSSISSGPILSTLAYGSFSSDSIMTS